MNIVNITVRAKSDHWETSSEPFELDPLNISKYHKVCFVGKAILCFNICISVFLMCRHNHVPAVKITTPKFNVSAVSDRLLVELKITMNKEFDCQVKYSKVLFFFLELLNAAFLLYLALLEAAVSMIEIKN